MQQNVFNQIIRIYPMSLFDCMNVNLRYEIIIQKECNQKDKLLDFSLHVKSQEFLAGKSRCEFIYPRGLLYV